MSIEKGENNMRENETNKSREKIPLDDERPNDIMLRAITKMDETTRNCEYLMSLAMIKRITVILEENDTLHNILSVKEISDKLVSYACEGAHATICDGHSNDLDYRSKSIMSLIVIIIRRYGGAISSQTLNLLFGKCDEYPQALASLIDLGTVKCAAIDIASNGEVTPICFYLPDFYSHTI